MKDPLVLEYFGRKEREIRKEYRNYYRYYHSQILKCHAWLLCLHFEAINRLQDRYRISKQGFIVLMGAYVLNQAGQNGFRARKLSSTLLSWQHNRVYRHLQNLSKKNYIRIQRNRFSRTQYYWITEEGRGVIRAFSQHYWQVFEEVRGKLGEISDKYI
jgi:DNA-binding MarR family transcriptional regulator